MRQVEHFKIYQLAALHFNCDSFYNTFLDH